jgi:hypothetical protein
MSYRPSKLGKALGYAILIWLVGFVWGSFVFMTPALRDVPAIPHVSKNPVISFPLLIVWLVMALFLAKNYLKSAKDRATEGLKLGILFSVVNIALDLLVLVLMLRAGFGYFVSLTVWLAYMMLLIIPWLTGRLSQRAITD